MKQGIYIVVSKTEIVKAEIERPEFDYQFPPDGPSNSMLASAEDDYQDEISKWKDHCLSLPRIPIQGKHNWKVWQEVEEGKDFRIEIDAPFPEIAIPIQPTTSSQHDAKLPVSRLSPSDEEITNAANNHQLGGYEWQAEKKKSFELGAKWARMVMSAELSEGNNG